MFKPFALFVAVLAASFAFADTVHLKSGSSLTGKVGDILGDKIAFESEDLGDIEIEIEKIVKIDGEKMHKVKYTDNSEKELPLTVEDGVIALAGEKFDQSDVKKIDPAVETWHGSINLAFNASRGNTYANNWSVVGDIARRWDDDRLTGKAGYYYAETGTDASTKQKTSDRIEASLQHDHFWSAKLYHFENGKFEKDELQLLDRRIRLGLGLGYQWAEKKEIEKIGNWDFAQEAGANWIQESFSHSESNSDENYAALMYAHHYKFRPLLKKDVEFFHNLEYLPQVNDFDRFLINTDVGVTTKIIYNWDLLAKFEWDYNSKPASSRKKSDYRYLVGLGYKW